MKYKVICKNNTYDLNENIDSLLIKGIIENENESDIKEIHLNLYEDIFVIINENKRLELKDYDEKEIIYYFEGLSYFACDSLLSQLYEFIYKTNYDKIFKKKQKSIEAFFEQYIEKVNWHSLSQNTGLSEAFFERHINKVNWICLCQNTSLSEAFFERHIPSSKVDWYCLSSNRSLSETFFERHIDKVNWDLLSLNNVDDKTIKELKETKFFYFDKLWKSKFF